MNVDCYSKDNSCLTYFNTRNCAIECIRDGSSMQRRTDSAAAVGSAKFAANRMAHNVNHNQAASFFSVISMYF